MAGGNPREGNEAFAPGLSANQRLSYCPYRQVAKGVFLSGKARLINASARTLFDFCCCRRRLASIKFELLQCLRLRCPSLSHSPGAQRAICQATNIPLCVSLFCSLIA